MSQGVWLNRLPAVVSVIVLLLAGCTTLQKEPQPELGNSPGTEGGSPDHCLFVLASAAAGDPVDEQGCALFSRVLEDVRFEPGKSVLNSVARESLDELIRNMALHPEVIIQLQGHTDNRGSAADNLALSKERVLAVVRYLVVNGVDGRRLQPYGYGEARPRVSNETPEGRDQNRRIEIRQIRQVSQVLE